MQHEGYEPFTREFTWQETFTQPIDIALVPLQVNTAPIIADIPPATVGNEASTQHPNRFIYPDAIRLRNYAIDDGGVDRLVWSFEIAGEPIYSINGVGAINMALDDPTTPGAKAINTQVLRGEQNPDGDPGTITIRNLRLTPFVGTGETRPTAPGIIDEDTQVVTLYASDGTSYSQKEMMIYTDNDGDDRFLCDHGDYYDFTNDAQGFVSEEIAGNVSTTVTSNGICIEVNSDVAFGRWISPYGIIDVADHSVYRIRATMNSNQDKSYALPFWDIIIDNFDDLGQTFDGANAYVTDSLFLSNEGGASAPGDGFGIADFEMWFAPLPVNCQSWRDSLTGAHSPANDPRNDAQIIFRILNVTTSGYGGPLAFGQVCMQTMSIDRFDLNEIIEGETVMDLAINNTNYRGHDVLGSTTFDFDTPGQITIGPTDGNFELEISLLEPGDGDHIGVGGTGAADDDFPIVWESDQLYMIEMQVSAPTAADEVNPPDVIQIGMDPPSWEVFMLNSVTRGDGSMHNIGMPKFGSPQTYTAFYYSHQASLSSLDDFRRLRPRVQVINTDNFSFGDATYKPRTQNTGELTIHGLTIKKVSVD